MHEPRTVRATSVTNCTQDCYKSLVFLQVRLLQWLNVESILFSNSFELRDWCQLRDAKRAPRSCSLLNLLRASPTAVKPFSRSSQTSSTMLVPRRFLQASSPPFPLFQLIAFISPVLGRVSSLFSSLSLPVVGKNCNKESRGAMRLSRGSTTCENLYRPCERFRRDNVATNRALFDSNTQLRSVYEYDIKFR